MKWFKRLWNRLFKKEVIQFIIHDDLSQLKSFTVTITGKPLKQNEGNNE